MKTTTDNHIDKLLHEAMKRRADKVPPLADDFAEKVMKRAPLLTSPKGEERKRRRLWPYTASAVAACMVLLLVSRFSSEPVKQQPVVAEVAEQPAPKEPKASDYSESSDYSDKTEPTEPTKPVNPQRFHKPLHKEEPLLAQTEEEPVIPADKQALVNIYLAEEALQVAYELQAQQEELRTHVASLMGVEEPQPQPVIAF